MDYSACVFETDRLLVREWHVPAPHEWYQPPLEEVVSGMLTDRVTAWLPEGWRGNYTLERAREWIAKRDGESTVLLAISKTALQPVGLLILFETPLREPSDAPEVRVGYLLAEASWGHGLASELVLAFVTWCRGKSSVLLSAGVSPENAASIAVLRKAGFVPASTGDASGDDGDLLCRLSIP